MRREKIWERVGGDGLFRSGVPDMIRTRDLFPKRFAQSIHSIAGPPRTAPSPRAFPRKSKARPGGYP